MKAAILFLAGCLCCLILIPTAAPALTDEEVRLLRQNGVPETTIRMMRESERRAGTETSDHSMGVRTITRPNGQPAIVYSTGSSRSTAAEDNARLQEERAWEMLRYLIVDTRRSND